MIEGIILSRSGSFRTDGESYIEDGILCLENDKTRIISATDFASIDSLKVAGTSSEGKSRLAVYCEYDDISEAIRFVSDSGTAIREYRMFGEHNTDLLAPVIQSLLTGGEISMVKSIQRFSESVSGASVASVSRTLTLSPVNPDKCFVLLNFNGEKAGFSYSDFTSTSITISCVVTTNGTVNVQIVELY